MKQESAELLSAPLKIFISSDGNELTFEREHKGILYYKYTKSLTKLGITLPIDKKQIDKLLRYNKSVAAKVQIEEVKEVKPIQFLPKLETPLPMPTPKPTTKKKPIIKQSNLFE